MIAEIFLFTIPVQSQFKSFGINGAHKSFSNFYAQCRRYHIGTINQNFSPTVHKVISSESQILEQTRVQSYIIFVGNLA